jgi:hypothetical protein
MDYPIIVERNLPDIMVYILGLLSHGKDKSIYKSTFAVSKGIFMIQAHWS